MTSRILFILISTFTPKGGMFEYLKAWVNQSEKDGVSFAIVASPQICDSFKGNNSYPLWRDSCSCPDIKQVFISSLLHTYLIQGLSKELNSAVSDFCPNLIHFVDIALYSDYFVSSLLFEKKKIDIRFTLHDPKFHDEKIGRFGNFFKKRLYKYLSKTAINYKNFSLHVHDVRLLRNTIFPKEIKFVELPHPLPSRIVKRRRIIFKEGEDSVFRIGFMGRIELYKGLTDLYEAFNLIMSNSCMEFKNIEILISGQGYFDKELWERFPCKIIIKNEFVDDIEFHQDMADLDLLVLPYRGATQSGVAAMAVSYGIPIIATKVGALDQLIIDGVNGVLVKPKAPQELAEELIKLVTNTESYLKIVAGARTKTP